VDALFRASRLTKRFGSVTALDDVDIEVRPGELVGLLGPNGAGKTTLVKIACGLVRPSSGEVTIAGHAPRSREARDHFGYLAELFRFPGWLTANELLELHQRLTGSVGGRAERAELLSLTGLADVAARRIDTMSKGMQQRLGIAQALVGMPRLLFLDEPTSALDPSGRHAVRRLLEELRGRGVAVLLNSHLLSEVERVCDRVAILDRGRIVGEGTPAMLTAATGVEIETDSGLHRYPEVARDEIPELVARLATDGSRIYAVRPLKRTLEEAYLDTIEGGGP
jgi:ABC-2 type transport system ATP-binding protein